MGEVKRCEELERVLGELPGKARPDRLRTAPAWGGGGQGARWGIREPRSGFKEPRSGASRPRPPRPVGLCPSAPASRPL